MAVTHVEMILRIALGSALGATIGMERDRHGRQAGLRTHLIVALASSTFMVVSAHFHRFQHYDGAPGVAVDPSRIAASVVTGIGFLAGGAILKSGLSVQGLTTAAGLWLVASIGLCSGAGMYPEALAATILGLMALTLFRVFEGKKDGLNGAGATVSDFDFERPPGGCTRLTFEVQFPVELGTAALVALLEAHPGVDGIQVHQPF